METYGRRGVLLVAGLAGDLEGNTVGGSVLELKGAGGEVVEILVKELLGNKKNVSRFFVLVLFSGWLCPCID